MRTIVIFAVAVIVALGVLARMSLRGRPTAEHGDRISIADAGRNGDSQASAPPPQHIQSTPVTPRSRTQRSEPEPSDPADPNSPTYDADKVIRANPGLYREQYARERRDEPWATQREMLVQSFALARLREVDPAASMEIECHTAICKINVTTKNAALDHWLGRYPLGACLAPTYAWTKSGDIYLVFDQATRDTDGLIEASQKCEAEQRDVWMSAVKSGKGPHE